MQPAKEKLHTLYKIYEKPMYHIAYAILHHTQQTEDAVSEAFCRVIANLHKIGDPESPQTRQYRKNARESDRRSPWDDKFLQIPEDAPPCPLEQQEEQAMRQAVLAEMMEVLNETDRKIVLLRCQENLSFREIARQCGIKEAAARKRFERARKAMIKQKGVTSYEQLFSL